MNILLFVTTMIMVIASLTYARLETYRSLSLKQVEFNRYMNETERGFINKTALWWYINTHVEKKTKSTSPTKNTARSRLSFLVFVDKKVQAKQAQEFPKLTLLAKKLIYSLYKNQPFFQEFLQQRSDIVDALLASLMVAENLPNEQKLKKAADLANLNFGDPALNSFLYFILKGLAVPPKTSPQETQEFVPLGGFISQEQEGEADDESEDTNLNETLKSPKGYYSLLDFITLEEAEKIRLYLASKELLKAIFDEDEVVDSIITLRTELYKKVLVEALSPKDASTQFQTIAAPKIDPNLGQAIFDFSISKTNPKNYE